MSFRNQAVRLRDPNGWTQSWNCTECRVSWRSYCHRGRKSLCFVCVYQRREGERPEVSTDRRVSCYAVGGSSRRNTRASLNAVSAGRSALNARQPPSRHRYMPNPGTGSGHQEQMLANSIAAIPQPSAGDDGDRTARPPPPSDRRPVNVTVLAEHRPPSALPVYHPRPSPRHGSLLYSDDKDNEAVMSVDSTVAVVDVSPNNHHICDSDVPTSSTPPQQQQQHHIVWRYVC